MWIFSRIGTISVGPSGDDPRMVTVRADKRQVLVESIGYLRLKGYEVERDPFRRDGWQVTLPHAIVAEGIAEILADLGYKSVLNPVSLEFPPEPPDDPDICAWLYGP